jgi:hypothetical protein
MNRNFTVFVCKELLVFITLSAGASFTKLTNVSDVSFGNFVLANAHNFEI